MGTYTSNYSFYKPGDDETADIGDLNNNADSIDSTIHSVDQKAQKALDSIAEEYDPSKTYNTRALVWHNGDLYVCVIDGATGSWDSMYWYQATVSGGLTGLQSELVGRFNAMQSTINSMWPLIYKTPTMIAEGYSTAKSYVVGDYVSNGFCLYKCIADTTGSWDDTAWEQTTVIDIIKGLNV